MQNYYFLSTFVKTFHGMDKFANRKNIILAVIAGLFVIILGRTLYMQVFTSYYKRAADQNVLQFDYQYPARGLIYDRHGTLLVDNQLVYDVMMIPSEVTGFDTAMLAKLLGIPRAELIMLIDNINKEAKRKRTSNAYQPAILCRQISMQTYAMLQENWYKFPGFYVKPSNLRSYPRKLAGNLIGYISETDNSEIAADSFYIRGSFIGKIGIERSYEKSLRGKRGVAVNVRDVHNRVQTSYRDGADDIPAAAGSNFFCTIDADLQEYGEKLMANKIGSIVAIEPATGEILALISSPNFDPSMFSDIRRTKERVAAMTSPLKPMYNRAVMAQYPPGSIFKLVNALIALQEGTARASTTYSCYGGYQISARKRVGCHYHPSPLNFAQSIQMSCNSYYCQVFRSIIDNPKYDNAQVGFEAWKKHAQSFGFGKKLESDIPNELSSSMPSAGMYDRMHGRNRWKSLNIISLAIGQGELGVTPLHMANLAAIIANRGSYYIPHLVKKIEGQPMAERFSMLKKTSIAPEHFDLVQEGMYLAVNGGGGSTARVAAMPDVEICGKTGTAQNPHGDDHSAFIAFAPRDNPRIAIAVYVENAGFGATYAAPIASLMIEKYLKREVARTWLEEKMINLDLISKHASQHQFQ
jgi:penicillin-binding protein 2